MQFASCGANPIVPTVRANGFNSITLANAAAGTYYFVGDGFNGTVGTDTFSLSVAAPTSASPAQETPPKGRSR